MATTDARDDAFIREVDDEYRKSQLEGYWSRYGRILAIAVVVLLAVLAAALYWREDRARRAGATGEAFNLALTRVDGGNFTAANPVFADLAANGSPGYRALARLQQAAIAVQTGESAKGLALYRGIAADTGLAAPFRDLATIKATRAEFDTLPPATVIARLKTLAVPGDPWFGIAGEMTAVAEIKLGHRDRAVSLLVAIVRDASVAPSLRNRAAQLAIGLGTDPATLLIKPAGLAQ